MPIPARHHAASLFLALGSLVTAAQSVSRGVNLDGHQVPLLSNKARIAVLFFIASDCPISNRYQPEMLRLEKQYSPSGVAFWFVYPNLTETIKTIRNHQNAFAGGVATNHLLVDPTQQLARLTGAKVTPEAAILSLSANANLQPVYIGRIDDRYLSIGNERPEATHHDFELALRAALAGDPVPPPTGPQVGCAIVSTR